MNKKKLEYKCVDYDNEGIRSFSFLASDIPLHTHVDRVDEYYRFLSCFCSWRMLYVNRTACMQSIPNRLGAD